MESSRGEGDDNAPASQTKVGVLSRSIAEGSILDKSFFIEINPAQGASGTMVRKMVDL